LKRAYRGGGGGKFLAGTLELSGSLFADMRGGEKGKEWGFFGLGEKGGGRGKTCWRRGDDRILSRTMERRQRLNFFHSAPPDPIKGGKGSHMKSNKGGSFRVD